MACRRSGSGEHRRYQLINAKTVLHFLEGESLGLGIEERDDEELQNHHRAQKTRNGYAPEVFATTGKSAEMMAFMIQWEELPRP